MEMTDRGEKIEKGERVIIRIRLHKRRDVTHIEMAVRGQKTEKGKRVLIRIR